MSASLLPLAAIAASFFMPAIRGCERLESPFENAAQEPTLALLAYPHLLALPLAVLAVLALARGSKLGELFAVSAGVAAVSIAGVLMPLAPPLIHKFADGEPLAPQWPWLLAALPPALAVAVWNRARKTPPESSWPPMLCAFALGSLGAPASLILGEAVLDDLRAAHAQQSGPGAWLYFAALLTLATIGALGARRRA